MGILLMTASIVVLSPVSVFAQYDSGYDSGSFDTGSYDTGYDSGSFDYGSYNTGYDSVSYDSTSYDTGYDSGSFDSGAYNTGYDSGSYDTYGNVIGQYDGGNVIGQYDGNGNVIGQYDGYGNVIGQYNGGNVIGQYDSNGNVIGQYDGNGNVIGQYDPSTGQVIGQYDPSTGQVIGQYDPSTGQVIGQYDPSTGQVIGEYNPSSCSTCFVNPSYQQATGGYSQSQGYSASSQGYSSQGYSIAGGSSVQYAPSSQIYSSYSMYPSTPSYPTYPPAYPQPQPQPTPVNTPFCTINANPAYITAANQRVTLTWNSQYATTATLSAPSGSGRVALTGSQVVTTSGATFTLNVTGSNGSHGTCQVVVQMQQNQPQPIVYGGANLQSSNPVIINNNNNNNNVVAQGYTPTVQYNTQYPTTPVSTVGAPSVSLSQIPYTGFDLGSFGDIAYWAALALFAVSGAYLVVYMNGGVSRFVKRA
jgi:hypothetical protein